MTSDAPERRKLRKTTTKAHRKAIQDAKIGRIGSVDDVDDASTASRSSSNVVAGALSMTPTMSSGSRSMLATKGGRKLIVLRSGASNLPADDVDLTKAEVPRNVKSRGRKPPRSNTKRSSRSRGSQFAREVTSELQWPTSEAQWSTTSFDTCTSAADVQRPSLSRGEPVRLMTSLEQVGADALPRFSVSLFSNCDVTATDDARQVLTERAAATRREFGYHSNLTAYDAPRSSRAQSKESKIFSSGSMTSARVAQELKEAAADERHDVILRDVITTHLFHDPTFVQSERSACVLPRVSERCR